MIERRFQPAHLVADGGYRQPKFFRCRREAAETNNRLEGAEGRERNSE
ncbi:MAG: hypothetical protein P0Y59_16130 [Candidatus Sphingomonas phytovorans]|nr:hypothetical protein [Sphingomonas sp.]WEJ98466.1 MAG: hypothetical protein P0Y59_16130 [Sphingomonas sp.]